MKKLVLGILIGAAGVYAWNHVPRSSASAGDIETDESTEHLVEVPDKPRFKCDGREYCSQMTSCEEAMYFLENCPNVKMDGEGDGIPCEKQWCGHH